MMKFIKIKKLFLSALIATICIQISTFAVSCKQNNVENTPDVDPVQLMREYGKWICNQDTVLFKDINYVYRDDSLAIIHAVLMGAPGKSYSINSFPIEYVWLKTGVDQYEVINFRNDHQIYLEKEEWGNRKSGEMYEPLNYVETLRYLAMKDIIFSGKRAGWKSYGALNLPILVETGYWDINKYKNTDDPYIEILGAGVKNHLHEPIKGCMTVNDKEFFFNIYGEDLSQANSLGLFFVDIRYKKDGESKDIGQDSFILMNVSNTLCLLNYMYPEEDFNKFIDHIKDADYTTVNINDGQYILSFNVRGFENTMQRAFPQVLSKYR
ncbi:MAG: hypothetical protein J1F07_05940 [Muribaculaceae bacterium]|nr:hypothetical protein [Muribaculaceae bacterium]